MTNKIMYEDVYEYDIHAAHPTILKNIDPKQYTELQLDQDKSKKEKNIAIGKLIKDKFYYRYILNGYTESVAKMLFEDDDSFVMTVYDSAFITKKLTDKQLKYLEWVYKVEIKIKNHFEKLFIINEKQNKYIGFNKSSCILKGYSKTIGIEQWLFDQFKELNNEHIGLFLENLYNNLVNEKNIDVFAFDVGNDKIDVYVIEDDENLIKTFDKSFIPSNVFEIIDIDYYYDLYLLDITKKIVEFVKEEGGSV